MSILVRAGQLAYAEGLSREKLCFKDWSAIGSDNPKTLASLDDGKQTELREGRLATERKSGSGVAVFHRLGNR